MVLESNTLDYIFLQDGENGVGTPGKDGKTLYTWVKYSQNADGSNMSDSPENALYIGIAYNKDSATESTNANDYNWTKIKGEQGLPGADAYTIILSNESHTFSGTVTSAIASSTKCYIIAYKGTKQLSVTIGTISNLPEGMTAPISNNGTTNAYFSPTVTSSMTTKNGTLTIPITVDGKTFTKYFSYSLALQGNNGISATNIILSNESHTFSANASGQADATSINIDILGFTGTTQVRTQIGELSGLPTGMTMKINNNGTINTSITVSVTSSLITSQGAVKIPITADGITVEKSFSYALSKTGETGAQGIQGLQGEKGEQGIPGTNGKTSYFHIKYSSVSNPTSSSQMTETSSTYIGTYVDFSSTDSTDPSKYTWSRFEGAQGAKGDQGIPGTNGTNGKTSYLHIAYANSSDGKTGFSVSDSTNKSYIGQYTDFTSADSTDYTKYCWTKIKGETGAQGKGIKSVTNYYLATSSSSGVTTSTSGWTTSIQSITSSKRYLWNYEIITYTDNTTSTTTPVIIGVWGNTGSTGETGKGIKSITEYYLASSASSGVTTSTSGWSTSMQTTTTTNKYLWNYEKITYTDDTTSNSTVRIIGTHGATGAAAKSVVITASSQVFKSTDGGNTFSPDTVKLTPVFQGGISYSKWQYSVNGGSTWIDVTSGSHGLTISSGVLSIAKTSDLFTDTVTSISFKCISNNSTYYDIMTVLKLYDVTDIEIGGTQILRGTNTVIELTSTAAWSDGKWRSASGGTGTRESITITDAPNANIKVGWHLSSTSGAVDIAQDSVPVTNGNTYTMSCYAKGNGNLRLQYGKSPYPTKSYTLSNVTKWKQFSFTFTIGGQSDNSTNGITNIYFGTSSNGDIQICGMKLEKGNKCTDWALAPEDIENQFTTVTNSIKGVANDVDQVNKKIIAKVWQNDISDSINNYDGSTVKIIRDRMTSTETDISGIKTTLSDVQTTVSKKADGSTVQTLSTKFATMESNFNGFKTTVSNTYTTKEDFNNLEIGGRNLLRGTKFNTISNISSDVGSGVTCDVVNQKDSSSPSGYSLTITRTDSTTTSGGRYIAMPYKLTNGKVYTWNFYAKGNGSWDIGSEQNGIKRITLTSEYVRYSHTFTANNNSYYQFVFYTQTKNANITICGVKLEVGNKATDWTPAPEDVEQSITNVSSQYTQLADKFNWIVKSGTSSSDFTITDRMATLVSDYINLKGLVTFSGLDSTAQSKITTAQSTADSAKTSASNAQSTANSAVTKADNAQTTANTAKTNAATAQSTADSAKTAAANAQSKADSLGVVHSVAGNGNTNMYIHFATISTTNTYLNYTISFRVVSRGYEASNVQIQFVSQNASDPNVSYFRANGDVPLYMVKSATSTWYVVMKKNEPWGDCIIDNYYNASDAKVTWVSNHLASLPSGYISSSWLAEGKLAQTVKSTVDNGKSNWDTAYSWTNTNGSNMTSLLSMVKKWTNNAVSDTTTINGGWISTNTITASQIASGAIITAKLATDAIKSTNYSYSSGNFSYAGTFLDLSTGLIRSKNFAIDSSGNAYFKGNIQANAGYIGGTSGWSITTNTITGNENSKIISGILESSNFVENSTGVQINLNTGLIKGNIEASTLAAKEALQIYVGDVKRNVIIGRNFDGCFYTVLGCDLTIGNTNNTNPYITIEKNQITDHDLITMSASYLTIYADTFISDSFGADNIYTYTTGGSWISGKTSAAINILTQQSNSFFHPVLRIQSYSGNVWCLGGLGDLVGIYGYKSSRTANGTDWSTTWNTHDGSITTTGNLHVGGLLYASAVELSYTTPYIDFHYGKSSADFTSRIIASGNGILDINQSGQWSGIRIDSQSGWLLPLTNGGYSLGSASNRFYMLRVTNGVDNSSIVDIKTQINPFTSALEEIDKTDVFNYKLKANVKRNGDDIIHTGFVIGEGYNCSDYLISESREGIDLYSAIGVTFGGVKELYEIVKQQQKTIEELKERLNDK